MFVCPEFKYICVILVEIGISIKQGNMILSKLGRQCMSFFNDFEILTFQLTCKFDQVILPVALYGCEIWVFENSPIIDKLLNDFLRQTVCLSKSTPIYTSQKF